MVGECALARENEKEDEWRLALGLVTLRNSELYGVREVFERSIMPAEHKVRRKAVGQTFDIRRVFFDCTAYRGPTPGVTVPIRVKRL
jgi:hypothetical protein